MRLAAGLLSALMAFPGSSVRASEGTDFLVGFVEHRAPGEVTSPQLRLIVSGAPGTTGTVSAPGIGLSSGFAIPAEGVLTTLLPSTAQATGSDAVTDRGI